ncbi:MAG: hypothetical protein NVS1B2_27270 [Vulcanimicrobiaceae bacterium]
MTRAVIALAAITLGAAPSPDAYWRTVQYRTDEQVSVSCAAALLCEIRLQPGEKVRAGFGALSDLWESHLTFSGAANEPHLVLKPRDPGLRENVIVTTNRRTYRLFLRSTASATPTYLTFRFDDEERALARHAQRMQAREVAVHPTPRPIVTLEDACAAMPQAGWRMDPNPAMFHPRQICQTPDHTFIALPLTATAPSDLPVPLAASPDGDHPVNYRYDAATRVFAIDGAQNEYALVATAGRNTVRLRVQRIEEKK